MKTQSPPNQRHQVPKTILSGKKENQPLDGASAKPQSASTNRPPNGLTVQTRQDTGWKEPVYLYGGHPQGNRHGSRENLSAKQIPG